MVLPTGKLHKHWKWSEIFITIKFYLWKKQTNYWRYFREKNVFAEKACRIIVIFNFFIFILKLKN